MTTTDEISKLFKTKEEMIAEMENLIWRRHAKLYKYKVYEHRPELYPHIITYIRVEYRHGSIEIEGRLTKQEVRDRKLTELGI